MNKDLGRKILELRALGYSYNKIASELNCSKSLICYHCGENQKNKNKNRGRKNKKQNPLKTKLNRFQEKTKRRKKISPQRPDIYRILINKRHHFNLKGDYMFTIQQLMEKLGENPKCYLTGKSINLADSRTYSLDHIVPRSKGGDNSLENCGLTCSDANRAKHDLTLEEFIALCKSVVDNFK
jgi:5-methylcytosine-specific restriction endonuclease McrA